MTLKRNLGFKLAMTSSGFALAGTFLNCIVAFAWVIYTNTDHENLTNAEKEWQAILKERELTTIKTGHGDIGKGTSIYYVGFSRGRGGQAKSDFLYVVTNKSVQRRGGRGSKKMKKHPT